MHPTIATIVRDAKETVIFARGEIDIANCEQLFAVIEPELGADTCVLIDLSQVSYMDSSCLNVLIRTRHHQDELGGTFVVQHPSATALSVLTITGLEHLIRR